MPRSRSSGGGSTRRPSSGGFGAAPARSSSTLASPRPTQTATRSPSTAPPPAVHSSSAPAHAPTMQAQPPMTASQQPSGGGGILSGIGSTIMQGMAFGGGSAVAHRAIDGIMGPRQVEHVHSGGNDAAQAAVTPQAIDSYSPAAAAPSTNNACAPETSQFQKCLTENNAEINKCQFYLDMLNQCTRNAKENARWQ